MSRRRAVLAVVALAILAATPAMAQEHEAAAGLGDTIYQYGIAALTISIAAAFGTLGQAKGLVAACEAISRNPGAAGPIRICMIIGLALIESIVIYALIIAFMILA